MLLFFLGFVCGFLTLFFRKKIVIGLENFILLIKE